MTLTHEEIVAMTVVEVNIAIAERLGELDIDNTYPYYTGDWSHAGRLLEMMTGEASGIPDLISPEIISRCWLEWYEVK